MKTYIVRSKDLEIVVSAKDRREAFIKFFTYVFKNWSKVKYKIGILAVLEENGEEYAFRTVPTLLNLKLIDIKTALNTLRRALGDISIEEISLWYLQDRWMVEEVLKNIRGD